jgi:phosphoribosylformylglycinamidine synthase PurS subunit
VARYVVDVMPKREILDPQGKAVLGALPRLGFEGVADVRQGKRFEVEVDGDPDDERLAEVRRMAETLLANPVIEDYTVTLDQPVSSVGPDPSVEPDETTDESDPSFEPDPSVEPVETTADPPGEDTQEVVPVPDSDGEGLE